MACHSVAAKTPACPGVVGEELQKAVDERSLPPWIWFMWIPQLLTSLTRPEVQRVKPILKQLAEVRAQYYLQQSGPSCADCGGVS